MPSIEKIIFMHNKRVLGNNSHQNQSTTNCNCRAPGDCPLSGSCKEEAIVYKAEVCSTQGTKTYIGSTETSFKTRYGNHKQSLEKCAKSTQTSLSKYVWELKDQQVEHSIRWQIVKRLSPFCDLCLSEKFFILSADPLNCINRNSELLQKCRHRNKFKLGNLSATDIPPERITWLRKPKFEEGLSGLLTARY